MIIYKLTEDEINRLTPLGAMLINKKEKDRKGDKYYELLSRIKQVWIEVSLRNSCSYEHICQKGDSVKEFTSLPLN